MHENKKHSRTEGSNPDGEHSIYIGELQIALRDSHGKVLIPTRYRHITIAGFDENGKQMWEFNGLATDPKTLERIPLGLPFNPKDRIMVHETPGPFFWPAIQNPMRVFRGNPAEISELHRRAREAGAKINQADLPYRAWLIPQNSNSVAGTLLKVMGLEQKEALVKFLKFHKENNTPGGFPNLKGFENDLLPGFIPSPRIAAVDAPLPEIRPFGPLLQNLPIPHARPATNRSQVLRSSFENGRNIDPNDHQRGNAAAEIAGETAGAAENGTADGTNNEQEPVAVPVPRPRPQLTPVKQGVLKGMPDDERLVLTAEFMALTGRKETDAAEAAMIERMEVQRKMAQDLADLKAGKLSTVWKETGYPKPVRDVLGEEAFQSFVDDRLEVASIAHASSGLHLLPDADLAGIADGTSPVAPADKNAAALITPKVQAAVAKSARTVLDLRQRTPAEAVLLSAQLGKRKAQFDASFDSGAAVDGDEMAAFLFYLETAQREIGTAEANIEPIPQSWAKQVAARFATPLAGGDAAPDRRSREAEIKQQYAELQQSFGPRTDDVIAYSLGRFGGNQAVPSGQGGLQ